MSNSEMLNLIRQIKRYASLAEEALCNADGRNPTAEELQIAKICVDSMVKALI